MYFHQILVYQELEVPSCPSRNLLVSYNKHIPPLNVFSFKIHASHQYTHPPRYTKKVCKQTFLCEPTFCFTKALFQFYIYIKSTEVSHNLKTAPSIATSIWNISYIYVSSTATNLKGLRLENQAMLSKFEQWVQKSLWWCWQDNMTNYKVGLWILSFTGCSASLHKVLCLKLYKTEAC